MTMSKFPVCFLCSEPIQDDSQEAKIKGHTGYELIHKSCGYQLMLGVIDETEARKKQRVPLNAPYDRQHIYDPVVRKAMQADETSAAIARMLEVKDELLHKGELSPEVAAGMTEDFFKENLDNAMLYAGAISKSMEL